MSDVSDDIAWVAAPPAKGDRRPVGRRRRFVTALQDRPGEWGQYLPGVPHNPTAASTLKRDYPGVETTSRRRPDGGTDIYARWVGNGNAS